MSGLLRHFFCAHRDVESALEDSTSGQVLTRRWLYSRCMDCGKFFNLPRKGEL